MTRNDPLHLRYDKLGPCVVRALQKRRFEAFYCPTADEAMQKAIELIPPGDTVSWGGSMTVSQIGLPPMLKSISASLTATPPRRRLSVSKSCGTAF